MSDTHSPPPSRLGTLFYDAAAAIGGGTIVTMTALHAGPVAVGLATGAVAMPFMLGLMNMMTRTMGRTVSDENAFALTARGLRNAAQDKKAAAMLLGVTSFFGMAGWAFSSMVEQGRADAEARRAEMAARTIIAPDTILQTKITRAVDLCVNSGGDRLPAGTQVPLTFEGQKVKVICPKPQ